MIETKQQHVKAVPVFTRKSQIGWCLYDWANSPFATLISTFVFATYYTQLVAVTAEEGASEWALAAGISGFIIAILAPITGAVADYSGCKKCWLGCVTVGLALASACMWFVYPDAKYALFALVLYVIANVMFETGQAFYNAMLGDIAPPAYLGRFSGWGWGLGYAGGLLALILTLFFLVLPETPPLGLDKDQAEPLRLTGPIVAIWLLVFSWPLFKWVALKPQKNYPFVQALKLGGSSLWQTLKDLPKHPQISRFLIARLLYTDGLTTLFALGGIFAAQRLGLETQEVMIFGIAITASAGIGAGIFAFLDDKWGPKTLILGSLAVLSVGCFCLLSVKDELIFYISAMIIGLCFGPIQASSRSFMTHITPEKLRTEYFGLYAMSGKATAFIGPLCVALVTEISGSFALGMGSILVFLIGGGVCLWHVRSVD